MMQPGRALAAPGLAITLSLLGACTSLGPDYTEPDTEQEVQSGWSAPSSELLSAGPGPALDPRW
ncbi:hypothetical protein N9241_02190, partial [bacterium]|nr:hypothetical protein [bacterium]